MRIHELEIRNIRGVKDQTLKPENANFAIWGTNGSGKSAVVDALDFLLTGKMSRLVGQGTGGITLKRHGAHIDCNDHTKAYVRALVRIKGVDGFVELKRSIADAQTLEYSDEYQEFISPIQEIGRRSQHILTRRDILRFITSEGKTRAKEIQNLMNLNDVENIRRNLVQVANSSKKRIEGAQKEFQQASQNVATRAGIQEFDKSAILDVINQNRQTLEGAPLLELDARELKTRISAPTEARTSSTLNIELFRNSVSNLHELLNDDFYKELAEADSDLRSMISAIHEDASLLKAMADRKFVQDGLNALDETENCPLCGMEWEPGELKRLLESKLAKAVDVAERISQIDRISAPMKKKLLQLETSIGRILEGAASIAGVNREVGQLKSWRSDVLAAKSFVENAIEDYHLPKFTAEQIGELFTPANLKELLKLLVLRATEQFPGVTKEQTSWDLLTELGVELEIFHKVSSRLDQTKFSSSSAQILLDEFQEARDEVLGALYDEIKDRFVALYRDLHKSDESQFRASISPSGAALDFEVDFHDRGTHPPHALHSEGHQDSMGVCLFLALSEKLTGDVIDLVILDDVVMSVDANHRKELCTVFKKHFATKQLFITTHDRTWASQLSKQGVVANRHLIQFFDWTIDAGPKVNERVDVWSKIEDALAKDDVPAAALYLRRGSEQYFAQVCDQLKAPIPYDLEGRHDLGEYLSAAMGQFSGLLKKAKMAAQTWKAGEEHADAQLLDDKRKEIYRKLGREQWTLNVNVHYNEWAEMTKEDFSSVVNAFQGLYSLFTCQDCGGAIYVQSEGAKINSVRCDCNMFNWNLVQKPSKT
jgi:hypothetical protein